MLDGPRYCSWRSEKTESKTPGCFTLLGLTHLMNQGVVALRVW